MGREGKRGEKREYKLLQKKERVDHKNTLISTMISFILDMFVYMHRKISKRMTTTMLMMLPLDGGVLGDFFTFSLTFFVCFKFVLTMSTIYLYNQYSYFYFKRK